MHGQNVAEHIEVCLDGKTSRPLLERPLNQARLRHAIPFEQSRGLQTRSGSLRPEFRYPPPCSSVIGVQPPRLSCIFEKLLA